MADGVRHRGDQVGERLAGPGPRLHGEMLPAPDRVPDRLRHRVLPGPGGPPDARHRRRQQVGHGWQRRADIAGRGIPRRRVAGRGVAGAGVEGRGVAGRGIAGAGAARGLARVAGWHVWNATARPGRQGAASAAGAVTPAFRYRAIAATMNHMTEPHQSAAAFRAARDLLLRYRDDYVAARREFSWPALDEFNWALDWFDVIAAEHPDRLALRILADGDAAAQLSYGELAARSGQVANWLSDLGARRGDRLLLMLGNVAPLWEVILAAMKLGVVIIPASTLLGTADLADRIARGDVRHVVADAGLTPKFDGLGGRWTAIAVGPGPVNGATPDGWLPYADAADAPAAFTPDGITRATNPLLLYFTSGTTAQPKLVEHTHASYPAGHLSTMYWIGVQPGDVHLNISSPGWAKHAWSNVFAPWNAAATALILGHERFSPQALLDAIGACGVTTFCAPPTVWRLLIQSDLTAADVTTLRECVAAGEPLNPEVIEQVRRAWDITVRDGYGQTETTAQIGNSPGQPVKLGSMGRALPGYPVVLVDPVTGAVGS